MDLSPFASRELRSCERFTILADYWHKKDASLHRFFRTLGASELGHYRVFLRLASLVQDESTIAARWNEMLGHEHVAIAAQLPGPRIHSGWIAVPDARNAT